MNFETDNDRMAFLADFGSDILINGNTVVGIFDNTYEDTLGVSVTTPLITVRDIDIPDLERGNPVIVNSISYTVAEIQPDGLGISHVILQKS